MFQSRTPHTGPEGRFSHCFQAQKSFRDANDAFPEFPQLRRATPHKGPH